MSTNKYYYYYLIYNIKHDSTLWIVDESYSFKRLHKKIKNFISKKEQYYIIQKIHTEDEMTYIVNNDFKRFRVFEIDKNCKVYYRTL